jgi:uncharacterized protein (TIGR00725 family)
MNATDKTSATARRINIGIVGYASIPEGSPAGRLAEETGRLLVERGFRVVTGGLGGVMEAACRGARSATRYKEGDTIGILPGHDPRVANEFVDIAIPTGLDHLRNSIVAHCDAVIAIGGGAGTLSEICFAWLYKRLVIALGNEGSAGMVAGQGLDHRTRYKEIPDDRVYAAGTPEEAVAVVVTLLPSYQKYWRGFESHTSP